MSSKISREVKSIRAYLGSLYALCTRKNTRRITSKLHIHAFHYFFLSTYIRYARIMCVSHHICTTLVWRTAQIVFWTVMALTRICDTEQRERDRPQGQTEVREVEPQPNSVALAVYFDTRSTHVTWARTPDHGQRKTEAIYELRAYIYSQYSK